MPTFVATAAVTFSFVGASDSTARTIPTADAVVLVIGMSDGTGDTVTATIAGAGPVASYQAIAGGGNLNYIGVFVGAPSGSQTVAISGGDAADQWSCGFRGINQIDTTTPFSGQVSDDVSPASIDVVTTSDGLAFGVATADNGTIATTDTEVMEGPDNGFAIPNAASSPGTGGTVALDWTGGGTIRMAIAVNLRNQAAAGGGPMFVGT